MGCPRIHSELLKLGIIVSERTLSRVMSDKCATVSESQLRLVRPLAGNHCAIHQGAHVPNGTTLLPIVTVLDQFVAETWMIAFAMVVRHVFRQRPSEVPLTKWNQPVRLEFAVRPRLGAGPGPCSERPNAHY